MYFGSATLAETGFQTLWQHTDPVTGGYQRTIASGAFSSYGDPDARREYEPMGAAVELEAPPSFEPDPEMPNYRYGGEVDRPEMGCELNGTPIRCDLLGSAIHATGGAGNLVGIAFRHQGYMPSLQGGPNPYAFRTATVGTRVDIRTCDGGNCGNWDYGQIESSLNFFSVIQNPQRAPLSPERDKAMRNALQGLTSFLKKGDFSEDCQKNVIDKLNKIDGFSLEKFIKFLEMGGDFYDGTTSQAIHSTYEPEGGFNNVETIAQYFERRKGTNAFTAYGSAVSKFTVFFRPKTIETEEKKSRLTGAKISGITNDNLAFIFHEGLHGFGNYIGKLKESYTDVPLQKALGVTEGAASINISNLIKENCLE